MLAEATDRQCTVCGAVVAAWPTALVCHCYEMPWVKIPAQDDRSPEGQDAEERLDAKHESAVLEEDAPQQHGKGGRG